MQIHSQEGHYTTVSAGLSDHPAVWATMDIQAPSPNPLTWTTAPTTYGAGAISMEVTPAADPAIDNIRLDEKLTFLYEPWEETAFASAPIDTNTSRTADADLDGLNNETEWMLNTNPMVANPPMSNMLEGGNEMTFEFDRRKLENVSIYAEWSPDLSESSWNTVDLTELVINDDGEIETVSVTLPTDSNQKFVRIKMQQY